MKRRRFVLGLGALAASGATLIGSGAIADGSADRPVTLQVAADSAAYLGLGPCDTGENDDFIVNADTGIMRIDLSEANEENGDLGDGVNTDAVSNFHNLFQVTNRGTQEVAISMTLDGDDEIPEISCADIPDALEQGDYGIECNNGDENIPAVKFYEDDDSNEVIDLTPSSDENGDGDNGEENNVTSYDQSVATLGPGESQCFGISVRTFGLDDEDPILDATITISAEETDVGT